MRKTFCDKCGEVIKETKYVLNIYEILINETMRKGDIYFDICKKCRDELLKEEFKKTI